jgi:hypothetical protein
MKKLRNRNTHHVFSQERFPELANDENNMVKNINTKRHNAYNLQYGNKTPEEIITIVRKVHPGQALELARDLNRTFFNNLYEVIPHEKKKVIIKPLFNKVYGPDGIASLWRLQEA